MRESIVQSADHTRMPGVIIVLAFVLALMGLTLGAFAILLALETGKGFVSLADTPITRTQYLLFAFPVFLTWSAVMVAGAAGLLTGERWARALLTKWAFGVAVLGCGVLALTPARLTEILQQSTGFFFGICSVYFLLHDVRRIDAYYERIENRH